MPKSSTLARKHCVPCMGGVKPLSAMQIAKYHTAVPEWEAAPEPDRIKRTMRFSTFVQAIAFVNTVADLAEAEGHHPNIRIFDYNRVTFELYTHKINGLHLNDFVMATKIDALYAEFDSKVSQTPSN